MNAKVKALLASYARSVLSAAVALYLSGVTDPTKLLAALAAGLLPVAIRYINPNDPAFGRVVEKVVADKLQVAHLQDGEAIIPKDILEKNKAIVDALVAEAKKPQAKKPAPKKVPAPKTTPKK